MARAMEEEFGEQAAGSSGVDAWAKANLSNSERDIQRVIERQGLRAEVSLSELLLDGYSIPWISPSTWLQYIVRENLWGHFAGLSSSDPSLAENTWAAFWDKFLTLNPNFQLPPGFNPKYTAACYVHGDEGRTLKKSALMIMGFQSCLGQGCTINGRSRKRAMDGDINLQVNYRGHSYTTRFVSVVLTKALTEIAFDKVAGEFARDLRRMSEQGFTYKGVTYKLLVISVKGDWPFLIKAGQLSRHFLKAVRKLANVGLGKGICHLCLAGTGADVPAEEVGYNNPAWLRTVPSPVPWEVAPPFIQHFCHDVSDPGTFFSPDLWHVVHLGVGKSFASSTIILALGILPQYCNLTLERTWKAVTTDYLLWCRSNQRQPFLTKIGPSTVSYHEASGAVGGWHKGGITTNLILWLEDLLRGQIHIDARIGKAYTAASNLNALFRFLYNSGAFLSTSEAQYCITAGQTFLRAYTALAQSCYNDGKPNLYPLMPKIHSMDHVIIRLHLDVQQHGFSANPMGTACQQDEDLVGRVSRVSRRVSIRAVVLRTFQRYLVGFHAAFHANGIFRYGR